MVTVRKIQFPAQFEYGFFIRICYVKFLIWCVIFLVEVVYWSPSSCLLQSQFSFSSIIKILGKNRWLKIPSIIMVIFFFLSQGNNSIEYSRKVWASWKGNFVQDRWLNFICIVSFQCILDEPSYCHVFIVCSLLT